jgi:hypothetical protein
MLTKRAGVIGMIVCEMLTAPRNYGRTFVQIEACDIVNKLESGQRFGENISFLVRGRNLDQF